MFGHKTMYISVINEVLKQMTSFHGTNIYQVAWQLKQVIIPLRDANFRFIISKLQTTAVQVLMCICLENDKVTETQETIDEIC